MPTTISVVFTKETGPPDDAVITASCTLEFDDEFSSLHDLDAWQCIVSCALMLCRQVIEDVPSQPPMKLDAHTGPVTAVNGTASKRRP
jgi:class 3 adenylate cyclase